MSRKYLRCIKCSKLIVVHHVIHEMFSNPELSFSSKRSLEMIAHSQMLRCILGEVGFFHTLLSQIAVRYEFCFVCFNVEGKDMFWGYPPPTKSEI